MRCLIVAIALVAVAVLAVPALAYSPAPASTSATGYRADFTASAVCGACHTDGGMATDDPIWDSWVDTKHAVGGADGQSTRGPESQCAGCHTSNYDPSKTSPSPSPSGTKTAWVYPYPALAMGDPAPSGYPMSETDVGCSSCHYNQASAHVAPAAEMANADICGQCHSRYSVSEYTFSVNPTPTPGAPAESIVQPQYAVGYHMTGFVGTPWIPARSLEENLHIQYPGWDASPLVFPSSAATPATPGAASGLMTYWKNPDGTDSVWQQKGHDGSAAQYPEWQTSGHANALTGIRSQIPDFVIDGAGCLRCHSADYIAADETAKPLAADAKYGITCVGCHTPHDKGTATGVWDEEFDAQLVGDPANPSDVCTQCHRAEHEGDPTPMTQAVAGEEIHNATMQIMNGVGAIGVEGQPSVHKGKCIQCHMVPTSYSRGSVQLGGNHTMDIVDPEVAAEMSPIPVRTTTPTPSGSPVVTSDVMPYSACSTCHGRSSDPLATYLQGTIEQRQEKTQEWIDECDAALAAAATKLGYASVTEANEALNDVDKADWTADQANFQKAFTNIGFVESEGSMGVHNWAYSSAVAQKAIEQANSVREPLTGITMNMVPAPGTAPTYTAVTPLVYGSTLTVYGTVEGGDAAALTGGKVQLWRKNNDTTTWNVVAETYVEGAGSNEYEFNLVPSKCAVYKVKFVGNETYAPIATGFTMGADVKWSVSFKASKTSVKKGTKITYSGAVGPGRQAYALFNSATPQYLILQKKSGSAWKTWKSVALNPDGSYKIAIKMGTKGKFTYRAFFAADTASVGTPPVTQTVHLANNSASKTITVK